MRPFAATAVAAVFGVGATEVPVWLAVALFLVGGGGVWKLITADIDRRLKAAEEKATKATARRTDADTAALTEEVQGKLMRRVDEQLEVMARELARTRQELGDARVELAKAQADAAESHRRTEVDAAEKDRKMDIMRREIARLHDEIGRLLANRDKTRRLDDDPDPPAP